MMLNKNSILFFKLKNHFSKLEKFIKIENINHSSNKKTSKINKTKGIMSTSFFINENSLIYLQFHFLLRSDVNP